MPKEVSAFECNICHHVFTGDSARQDATDCEAQGAHYRFRIGTVFYARVSLRPGLTKLKITAKKIVRDENGKHIDMYISVIVETGEQMHWTRGSSIVNEINRSANRYPVKKRC